METNTEKLEAEYKNLGEKVNKAFTEPDPEILERFKDSEDWVQRDEGSRVWRVTL